jgi:hypothetical protein
MIDRIILTEALREIRSGSPSARNPEHRVQKAAVVLGIAAGVAGFSRKQWLKALVLFVGQFIASSHRRKSERWCGQNGRNL